MNANLQQPAPVISAWLASATTRLATAGIVSAKLDAELILAHTLRKNRTYLHAHADDSLDSRALEIVEARLALRFDRIPVAYIIGHKEFYGRRFNVTTATLIPRPESEVMITQLLKLLPNNVSLLHEQTIEIVDVGTGSGCLGITAKLEYPEANVTLVDISQHALTIAEQNAKILQADVSFIRSDLLENYSLQPSIILANLPYVDPNWERSPETDHEPAEALFTEDHGMALSKKCIQQAALSLLRNGYLLMEADPEQHDALEQYAGQHGLKPILRDDYIIVLQRQD